MLPSPEILAVTFDLDGLMFNTEDLYDEVSQQVLSRRGHHFSKELKLKMMGLPGVKAMEAMRQYCGLCDPVELLLDEIHEGMFRLLPGRLLPMPGLLTLLDQLDQWEIPRSIATSSSRRFLDRTLAISGLTERFRFTLTSEDVVRGKPHPDVYLESAKRHGIPPPNMLVLEDSEIGTQAAAAAGAFTVAVPGVHSSHVDFGHVDIVLNSLADAALAGLLVRPQRKS
jgi:HAD superfamily hydrolase (TIGR01509 family)